MVIALNMLNMHQIQILCIFCSSFVMAQIYIKLYVNCHKFTKKNKIGSNKLKSRITDKRNSSCPVDKYLFKVVAESIETSCINR